jgi:ABC-2 type transport system permease protein
VGWLVAYAVMSAIIGSIINDLGDMMDTPQAQQMIQALGGTDVLLDAFISLEFSILAFVTAAYGIVAAHRLTTEETDGHAEPLLATSVSRLRFLMSHLTVAVVGTTLLTLTQGAAFALANAASTGDTGRIGATIGAAMAYLPAIWLMTATVILLFGVAPRLTFVAWVLLVGFLLVSEIGALLDWPNWLMQISPFEHIPRMPAVPMEWTPMVALLLIAGALMAVGSASFRRRDLSTP